MERTFNATSRIDDTVAIVLIHDRAELSPQSRMNPHSQHSTHNSALVRPEPEQPYAEMPSLKECSRSKSGLRPSRVYQRYSDEVPVGYSLEFILERSRTPEAKGRVHCFPSPVSGRRS
ncbi:MAG: hypothetical protein RQ728_10980 [Brevefilum sp.]|nr:hypothetical protein [Brevefilum sp.]